MKNKKKKAPRQRQVVSLGTSALAATGAVMAGSALVNFSTASANDLSIGNGKTTTQTSWTANSVVTVQQAVQKQGVSQLADYQVQWGDTLSAIAQAFQTTPDTAAGELGLTDHGLLIAGQTLGQQAELIQKLQAAGLLNGNQQAVQADFGHGDQNLVIVQPGTPTVSTEANQQSNGQNTNQEGQSSVAVQPVVSSVEQAKTVVNQTTEAATQTTQPQSGQAAQSNAKTATATAEQNATNGNASQSGTKQTNNSVASQGQEATNSTAEVADGQAAPAQAQQTTASQTTAAEQPTAQPVAQQTSTTDAAVAPTTLSADATQSQPVVTPMANPVATSQVDQAEPAVANQEEPTVPTNTEATAAVGGADEAGQATAVPTANTTTGQGVDSEAVINWFYNHMGQLTYDMSGSRNGTDGTADCSGSMTEALYEAGASKPAYLYNTDTLPNYLTQNGYQLIANNQPWDAQRGDIVICGTPGASAGSAGHVQVMTDGQNAISVNYAHGEQEGAAVSVWNYQTAYAYNGGNMDYAVYRQ
ncbi:peptidoglycan amidohydrolase family protein [Fructobacillus fructosus]|uniref:peptidoglycan amidohydrolase family protein n=1 Tax=Fructobacillus fructosus TaxID=1631 RepID=UPI00403478E6